MRSPWCLKTLWKPPVLRRCWLRRPVTMALNMMISGIRSFRLRMILLSASVPPMYAPIRKQVRPVKCAPFFPITGLMPIFMPQVSISGAPSRNFIPYVTGTKTFPELPWPLRSSAVWWLCCVPIFRTGPTNSFAGRS